MSPTNNDDSLLTTWNMRSRQSNREKGSEPRKRGIQLMLDPGVNREGDTQ